MPTKTRTRPEREHEEVFTIDDLAKRLGVSGRTVRNWRSKGLDPVAIKIGGFIRYKLSDIEAWEEAHRERR
ncbi:helix-turn-helix transcriptional regulator [Rothia nasimurium]|uniref:helix-turn-helix transcriptional regulator n=1 Tax=Rothia nasimurium TaxID=85336 RepID=UPI001F3048F2|nr:helix-turn-helix domain-containing protein [Rothia nasimurium]